MAWTTVLGLVCPLVGAATLTGGCSMGADCIPGERRCTQDGTIEECRAHPSGTDVSVDPVDVHHHDSSPNTWQVSAACGAGLCQTERVKDSRGVTKQDAFCTLSPTPEPSCTEGAASACDGTTSITCRGGYAIAEVLCASCDTGAGGCTGSLEATCNTTSDCAPGLVCDPVQGCQMPCACADGTRCTSCDAADRETVGPTRGAPFVFVCNAGTCARKYE